MISAPRYSRTAFLIISAVLILLTVLVIRLLGNIPARAHGYQNAMLASDTTRGDWFGDAMALSADVLAVAAFKARVGWKRSGAIYVFDRSADGWQESDRIEPPEPLNGMEFGFSVDIDDNWLAIGAVRDNGNDSSAEELSLIHI